MTLDGQFRYNKKISFNDNRFYQEIAKVKREMCRQLNVLMMSLVAVLRSAILFHEINKAINEHVSPVWYSMLDFIIDFDNVNGVLNLKYKSKWRNELYDSLPIDEFLSIKIFKTNVIPVNLVTQQNDVLQWCSDWIALNDDAFWDFSAITFSVVRWLCDKAVVSIVEKSENKIVLQCFYAGPGNQLEIIDVIIDVEPAILLQKLITPD